MAVEQFLNSLRFLDDLSALLGIPQLTLELSVSSALVL